MANHKVPKCPDCGRYMCFRHYKGVGERTKGLKLQVKNIYTYYCDNISCGNQRDVDVIEWEDAE